MPQDGTIEQRTSQRKTEANRRNALRSTGPTTPEGKGRVRLNARQHGLFSQEILLPGEDGKALAHLAAGLRAELQPVGEVESLLVDRIIAAVWRLRRLGRVEAGIFAWELYGTLVERAEEDAKRYQHTLLDDLGGTQITHERKYRAALSRAEEAKALQEAETATFGLTFIRDAQGADAFSKLSRYETTIERSLWRALHELQRLQQGRLGAHVPPSMTVDVSGVSGEAR